MRMQKWKLTHHAMEDLFCTTSIERDIGDLETLREAYDGMLGLYSLVKHDLADKEMGYH